MANEWRGILFFLTNHRAKLNKPSQTNSLLGVNHLILEGVGDFEKENSCKHTCNFMHTTTAENKFAHVH